NRSSWRAPLRPLREPTSFKATAFCSRAPATICHSPSRLSGSIHIPAGNCRRARQLSNVNLEKDNHSVLHSEQMKGADKLPPFFVLIGVPQTVQRKMQYPGIPYRLQAISALTS